MNTTGSSGSIGGLAKIADAQDFLQISRTKLYTLMRGGELHYVKLGRNRRIPWSTLHEFVARLTRSGVSAVEE